MTKELKFAIGLAKKSGKLILAALNEEQSASAKTVKRDICTSADLAAEKLIVEEIKSKFPTHNIIREEGKNIQNGSDYTWLIDALDGTKYFISGIKFFTTSIALWHKNKPIMGVIYQPGTDECWFAEKGKGVFLNDRKLKVAQEIQLKNSIISLDINHLSLLTKNEQKILFERLKKIAGNFYRFRVIGSGSLSLCYLAMGHFDAYFDLSGRQEMWDLGAGLIIAQEAGAKITDLNGSWPGIDSEHLVVTNGKIHDKVLKLLQ